MKAAILNAISEPALRTATTINAALAANDRLKYAFSLLQAAATHARKPDQPAPSLQQERIACGIEDETLDLSVAGAAMVGDMCKLPGSSKLVQRIADDLQVMALPVLVADPAQYKKRVDAQLAALPPAVDDVIDLAGIAAMMLASGHGNDSPHRLVMDLHKQLNILQANMSQETLDGASVYGLAEADRTSVTAFMKGLNHTARLKFSHPGLATTATRIGPRLIIQNDLGTTDAHVIVIHVEGKVIDITYTDVHPERLAFFQSMLEPRKLEWGQGRSDVLAAGSAFYLTTGHCEAADDEGLRADLEFVGSRLVFLIDWNRARKQLRGFLRNVDRLALLSWAAKNDLGHCGFLEMGGAALINQAIEATGGTTVHFGDRLCDVLSDAVTVQFLQFAFQTATAARLSGESCALVHDRIRVALAAHFSNEDRQLMLLVGDHAGLIFEIASLVSDEIRADDSAGSKRAHRARRFEHDADQLVVEARKAVARRPDQLVFQRLLEVADDAADGLEDAAALLALRVLEGKPCETLQALAEIMVDLSQEWIKAIGHAGQIGNAASHAETEDFLRAIDRVAALEHQADEVERALTASAIEHAHDFRQLHLFTAIGGRLEAAADALNRASLMLHDHVLEALSNG